MWMLPILFQEFFFRFLERAESVDRIIVLQMAPSMRAYPLAAPLVVCGLAHVWAAKMVAAESWHFRRGEPTMRLEFARAFSDAIVQQANSR